MIYNIVVSFIYYYFGSKKKENRCFERDVWIGYQSTRLPPTLILFNPPSILTFKSTLYVKSKLFSTLNLFLEMYWSSNPCTLDCSAYVCTIPFTYFKFRYMVKLTYYIL